MSSLHNIKLGQLGEKIAADFLVKNGYKIVDRNRHISKNEIDIIAEDSSFLVFVEVKTRSVSYEESSAYGSPGRAVDYKKRSNIVLAAKTYLMSNYTDKQPRIDVIEVYLKNSDSPFPTPTVLKINHIDELYLQ